MAERWMSWEQTSTAVRVSLLVTAAEEEEETALRW
jgi:hypothetical protein